MTSWTVQDVEQWLHSLNLSTFVENFCRENGIDGLTLLLMKEEDLRQQSLAIERLCDRKKLWYHIRLLQCQQNEFYCRLNEKKFDENHSSLAPSAQLVESKILCNGNIPLLDEEEKHIFKTLKGEKRKTLVSFLYALCSGIWTSFIMVVVHNRVPNVQK